MNTTSGGEDTVTLMVGSLLDSVESYHGRLVTRLYRAIRPAKNAAASTLTFRRFLGIPHILIYLACVLLAMLEVILIVLTVETDQVTVEENMEDPDIIIAPQNLLVTSLQIVIALVTSLLALVALVHIPTGLRIVKSLFFSQRSYLHSALADTDLVRSEGQLEAIRGELRVLTEMVEGLDSFTQGSSRLTLVVEGLDIMEQRKVLKVLDTVNVLFSDPDKPFIILLAIDPHVIIKAIELNINEAFADTSVGGFAYLRNMVHLPFFLQTNAAKKIQLAQALSAKTRELFTVDSEARMKSHTRLSESSENMFSRQTCKRCLTLKMEITIHGEVVYLLYKYKHLPCI